MKIKLLNRLNNDILENIKSFLWGNHSTWKLKLNITNEVHIPPDFNVFPKSTKWCCECGEKKYIYTFKINKNKCFTCLLKSNTIAGSSCTTWTGGHQGHLLIQNKLVCLYSSKVNSLEKKMLCCKELFPYLHPKM